MLFMKISITANHIRPTSESPMIVIDTDVDSCGMSYLVKAEKQVTHTNCIQHLLGNPFDVRGGRKSLKSNPFISQLIPVGNAYGYEDNEAILLLPAMDNKNIGKDAKNNYAETSGHSFMKSLQDFLEFCADCDVPAVIFDSSVGNTALANISNEAANIIICVMRPTTQFVNGTRRYLLGVENDEKMLSGDKHIVLVPNVIPQEEVSINGLRYPDAAMSKICNDFPEDFQSHSSNTYHFDMLDRNEFGIPAVKRFMWIEDALYTKPKGELNDNEKQALERYRKLAQIIDDIDAEY